MLNNCLLIAMCMWLLFLCMARWLHFITLVKYWEHVIYPSYSYYLYSYDSYDLPELPHLFCTINEVCIYYTRNFDNPSLPLILNTLWNIMIARTMFYYICWDLLPQNISDSVFALHIYIYYIWTHITWSNW